MKRFKEFINEGNAMDYLKPKSDEDIEKQLSDLSDIDKLKSFYSNKLPNKLSNKYKPKITKELITEMKDKLMKWLDGNRVNKLSVLYKKEGAKNHIIVNGNEKKLKVWVIDYETGKGAVGDINYDITWDQLSDNVIIDLYYQYSILSSIN